VREDYGDRERQEEDKNRFHDETDIDSIEREAEALLEGQPASG
jgi:hypothetical protein